VIGVLFGFNGLRESGGDFVHSQHVLLIDESDPPEKQRAHVILALPKVVGVAHDVFAEAMLEDASSHQRRNAFDWIASVGVHFAILAVLLVLPLYFTTGLDTQKLNLTFLATPSMPAGPPPPPPLAPSALAHPPHVSPSRTLKAGELIAPTFIPKAIMAGAAIPSPLPDEALAGVPGGVPGGIPGGVVGGAFGGVLGVALKALAPPAAIAGPKAPVRVGGDVKPPRLLYGPEPDYPTLARQAKISGVVIIEAVIDEFGSVRGMRVISGHPMLVHSALTAVSKRKYEPTILDGEPTPIDLRVEISFTIA
jgi:periplasmic protein TonB